MDLLTSIIVAAAATFLVDVALVIAFFRVRHGIDHEPLHEAYLRCDGGWHEAHVRKCDQGLRHFPQQPINTYSNLAFVAAGTFIGSYVATPNALIFMVVMVLLAIGSALYHGLSVRWAAHMDVLAIYWVLLVLMISAIAARAGLDQRLTSIAAFVGGAVVSAYLRLLRKDVDMMIKIGLLLAPVYALAAWHAVALDELGRLVVLGVSLGLFVIAFVIWNLDKRHVAWLQAAGHGIWHMLAAAGFALIFWAVEQA
ncbi:MAG: ceramidase domain-containing protein [Spirochaetales bacterium]